MHARLIWLLCTLIGACAGRAGPARTEQYAEIPLAMLVPKGPRWLIQARPSALAEQDAARVLWRTLVSEERERAFTERTGVDPMKVEEVVGIELPPSGYLLIARGPFDAVQVVERAGERLALGDVRTDAPVVRREGLAGQGRYAYAAIAEHTLLVARDAPPQLISAVLTLQSSLARRSASEDSGARAKSGTARDDASGAGGDVQAGALGNADARSLYAEHAASPLVLFAPEPLALEPGTNVALLFARERALAASVRPSHNALAIGFDLRGEFPPGAENNFRALARSLASAPLGRALGLSRVPDTMAIRVDAQGTFVTFALEAAELVAGVRMLFFDDLRQLFDS